MKNDKSTLKQVGEKFLPKEVLQAPKHGFSAPLGDILVYYKEGGGATVSPDNPAITIIFPQSDHFLQKSTKSTKN